MKVSAADWFLLSPELFLTAAGLLILSIAVFVEKAKEEFLAFLALIVAAFTSEVKDALAAERYGFAVDP